MCDEKEIRKDLDEPGVDILTREDVTGTIGQWLDMDNSDIPANALYHLEQAYKICAESL